MLAHSRRSSDLGGLLTLVICESTILWASKEEEKTGGRYRRLCTRRETLKWLLVISHGGVATIPG